MRRIVTVVAGAGLLALHAAATPWWVAYEGDVFPETLPGWTRVHGSIPAQRWIEDGSLFIDSRESVEIYDYYRMLFDHPIDPQGQNETFVLSWRLKADAVTGYYDPSIGVTSDAAGPYEFYSVAFGFRVDAVLSIREQGVSAPIAPGVFHDYEMRSQNMRTYALYVDGTLAMEGQFVEVFGPTRISWGDTLQGGTSLAQWDYVRAGVVVPETQTILLALLVGSSLRRTWNGSARG